MLERLIQGAVSVIRSSEPMTAEIIEQADELRAEVSNGGRPLAVFDLSDTPLINGDGLEWLLDTRDQFLSKGGNLKIAAPNTLIRETMRVTRVDLQFEIFDQVSEAVGSYIR